MSTHLIQARISKDLKEQANAVFSSIGMSISDAIRVFLQQTVNTGGLPFRPSAKTPNSETIAAMNELENGMGKRFKTTQELFDHLGI